MSKGKDTTKTTKVELELFMAIEEECSSTQEISTTHSWVLDSGASYHMTHKKFIQFHATSTYRDPSP